MPGSITVQGGAAKGPTCCKQAQPEGPAECTCRQSPGPRLVHTKGLLPQQAMKGTACKMLVSADSCRS